ncbi:MAG: PQQ-binding-like beta-propeller repeat protein, partial [Myxococcales bacterium]|nr:PQQ-binding-like beta-propeller repeat protein [Myxococcales bacterium]
IIGLRWDWADEDAALVVVANDGRTFRRIWETRPFRAQWASASNQLALSERRLFMTDSEGTVRVIDLDTGNVLARSAGTRMNEICVANDGSGQVWVSGEVDPFPRGWLFGEDAKLTPRDRPGWCVKGPPACSGDEPTLCVPSARPAELAVGRARASVSRMAGIAVAVVTTDDDGGGSVIAYDPHTLAVRWRRPLALSAEPMHAAPSFSHQQDGDVLFIKYQLESGRWLLGARDLVTGDVLWSKSPLAAAGSHVPSMFAKSRRLYVRVNSRLEIIEGEKGTLLGVAR